EFETAQGCGGARSSASRKSFRDGAEQDHDRRSGTPGGTAEAYEQRELAQKNNSGARWRPNYGAAGKLRACRAIAISAEPPKIILMPTSNPSAQAAVPGNPAKMIVARTKSMIPLASIQTQRP